MVVEKTDDGRWIMKEPTPDGPAIKSAAVQDLIRTVVNDTMQERDRTVTIRIDPDGAISVSIYPTIN